MRIRFTSYDWNKKDTLENLEDSFISKDRYVYIFSNALAFFGWWDRELINLLLERLRDTQITIEKKQEEVRELTTDLNEQRERRMSAENYIKRHRQEAEAHHSRNSVDVHRQTVSWERYRALSEELNAVEEATKDAKLELRSCGVTWQNLILSHIVA